LPDTKASAEHAGKQKHDTSRLHAAGRWHSYILAASQFSLVWLATVGYTVAAGTSMQ
jgi:hypothetical protein